MVWEHRTWKENRTHMRVEVESLDTAQAAFEFWAYPDGGSIWSEQQLARIVVDL